jgi:hypothetical protein
VEIVNKKKLEKDLLVDLGRLDEEWCDQPSLFGRYALKVADARRRMDEAKSELDVVKAELDKQIRSEPEAFGLGKVTESAITALVPLQPEYDDANRKLIDARHELEVMQAMTSALDHKKAALSKLVDLFLADYFSKPKASGSAKEHMEDGQKVVARQKVKSQLLQPRE